MNTLDRINFALEKIASVQQQPGQFYAAQGLEKQAFGQAFGRAALNLGKRLVGRHSAAKANGMARQHFRTTAKGPTLGRLQRLEQASKSRLEAARAAYNNSGKRSDWQKIRAAEQKFNKYHGQLSKQTTAFNNARYGGASLSDDLSTVGKGLWDGAKATGRGLWKGTGAVLSAPGKLISAAPGKALVGAGLAGLYAAGDHAEGHNSVWDSNRSFAENTGNIFHNLGTGIGNITGGIWHGGKTAFNANDYQQAPVDYSASLNQ